jgi:putative transposase
LPDTVAIILSLFSSARHAFQTRAALEAEILTLRHQLLVLQRSRRGHRLRLGCADRWLWVWLARWWSGWQSALVIVKPETVIAWHRKGFQLYWKWKSCHLEGRPSVSLEVIDLIHRMSLANPCWGAPRIHGELLKLGFELSQATVAKYLVRHRKPPSQNWRTFLKNHTQNLVSADFFVVPTITFRLLFVFVILSHDRRRLVHFAITDHPTAEWAARQLWEAFSWDSTPRYLLRDRDGCYGGEFHKATGWAFAKSSRLRNRLGKIPMSSA